MQPYVAERPTDEDAPALQIPEDAMDMGQAGGLHWIRADDPGEPWRSPTYAEMEAAKLELPAVRRLKNSVARRIEREVGCHDDLIADMGRELESLTMLLTRFVADAWGSRPIDPALKAAYVARVEAVVDGVDAGDINLRGDYESPEAFLARIQARRSAINTIIGEHYLPARDALLGDD